MLVHVRVWLDARVLVCVLLVSSNTPLGLHWHTAEPEWGLSSTCERGALGAGILVQVSWRQGVCSPVCTLVNVRMCMCIRMHANANVRVHLDCGCRCQGKMSRWQFKQSETLHCANQCPRRLLCSRRRQRLMQRAQPACGRVFLMSDSHTGWHSVLR
jgi:hypothetical protein